MMTYDEKRSRLYSYFYGKNIIFQMVMIGIAILLIAMSLFTAAAPSIVLKRLDKKVDAANDEVYEASSAYNTQCRNLYRLGIQYDSDEAFTLNRNDENYQAKKDYNEALADYQEAKEKYDFANEKYNEKYEKFIEARKKTFKMEKVYLILGIFVLIVALGWLFFKKFVLRDYTTEALYDEELAAKIEEAKARGLEKLNILSEQVEQVEPVVLNGVAEGANGTPAKAKKSFLLRVLLGLLKVVVSVCGVLLLLLPIYWLTKIGSPMVIQHILAFAGIGAAGFFAYTRFEAQVYIRPKTIDKLDKLPPHLVARIGTDDKQRVTLPAITVYMFGEEQLYIYYQYFNIITGKIFCEGVHEYFYEDIVGIISVQDKKLAFKRHGLFNLFLKITPYLKEKISVVSSGCTHTEAYYVDIGGSLLDTQFTAMRNLIRQKKESR